jgi:serine protease inhibitor
MTPRKRAGFLSACLILCFTLTLVSCKKSGSSSQGIDTPLDLPAGSDAVTTAANQFAVNVFQQTLQIQPAGKNMLISPMSIYFALGMTYNGAAGTTADSMAKALALTGIPTGQFNAVSKALLQQLPKEDNKVQLSVANSIWYNKTFPTPTAAFGDTVANQFQATLQGLDFSNASSTKTINTWVAKNTGNKIPTIIQSLSPDDIMLLVNAIYFNGSWLNEFKTSDTHAQSFYLSNGSTVNVPFMNQQVNIRTSTNTAFTLAELPYGTGKAFDMYLAIPNNNGDVNKLAQSLDATTLAASISKLDTVKVNLTIPKWEYAYSIDNMEPELSQMGMGIAFSGAADFANIYPTVPVRISKVIHKTYINVSEEGTQAAAVTAVLMTLTSVVAPSIQTIVADHPFVYFIVEKQTGLIIFAGVVNDPSQH